MGQEEAAEQEIEQESSKNRARISAQRLSAARVT
jgi:hypothetical protein